MWIWFVLLVFAYYARKWIRWDEKIDNITDRHVFITGCDSGFGRMLAERLAKKGVKVYAGCLLQASVDELEEKFNRQSLKAVKLDVTNYDDVKRVAKFLKEDLKEKALWALVNNAGVTEAPSALEWLKKQDYLAAFSVNLFGMIDVTTTFLPFIRKAKEGRIVNMSSFTGRFSPTASPYVVSKCAVEGFSNGLDFDMIPFNISVHTIEPGAFRTAIIDGLEKKAKKKWDELDPQLQEDYGECYLNDTLEMLANVHKNASDDCQLVVDAQEHAVLAKYPSERYVVGPDAKYLGVPLSYFPVWFQKKVVLLFGPLAGVKVPIPECTRKK